MLFVKLLTLSASKYLSNMEANRAVSLAHSPITNGRADSLKTYKKNVQLHFTYLCSKVHPKMKWVLGVHICVHICDAIWPLGSFWVISVYIIKCLFMKNIFLAYKYLQPLPVKFDTLIPRRLKICTIAYFSNNFFATKISGIAQGFFPSYT